MEQSCPPTNKDTLNEAPVSFERESDLHKADTSPSPTETICLESLCTYTLPGKQCNIF